MAAAVIDDPDHSDVEDHFVRLGSSGALRFLLVCNSYRGEGHELREEAFFA